MFGKRGRDQARFLRQLSNDLKNHAVEFEDAIERLRASEQTSNDRLDEFLEELRQDRLERDEPYERLILWLAQEARSQRRHAYAGYALWVAGIILAVAFFVASSDEDPGPVEPPTVRSQPAVDPSLTVRWVEMLPDGEHFDDARRLELWPSDRVQLEAWLGEDSKGCDVDTNADHYEWAINDPAATLGTA